MTTQARFWNKLAKSYSQRPVPDQKVYEKKLALTQALLNPTMDVLEIGCGTGTTSLHHAAFAKHITATDFSTAMIDIAKEKAAQQAIDNVEFKVESIESMHYANESFDIVMAHSILHLLRDPDATITAIYKALKPGGYFVSSTVCIKDISSLMGWVVAAGHFVRVFPFVNAFRSEWLLSRIMEAGFTIQHQWKPKSFTLFLIAKKPDAE